MTSIDKRITTFSVQNFRTDSKHNVIIYTTNSANSYQVCCAIDLIVFQYNSAFEGSNAQFFGILAILLYSDVGTTVGSS